MTLVDLAIVSLLALAVVHGITQGAAVQVLSFGGFWGGLWLGALIGPELSGLTEGPFTRAFLSLFVLFGLAVLGAAGGRVLGSHAWGALQRLKLGIADALLGAIVAIVATLVAVWLFAILLTAGPTRQVAAAMHESAIVRALVDRLPPAPTVFSRLQNFIDTSPFPRVFEGLEPTPTEPVDLPDDPTVQAAVESAGAATVRVVGLGCGGIQSGSGFVVAPNLVMTNAHVVAGIDRPTVEDRAGRHQATPVLFDPDLDVAVLRVQGLAAGPLPLVPGETERGSGGAVLGYPGGGPFTAGAGAVLRRFEAVGRDIYGSNLTRRDVYQIQGTVRQGNSGGPFVQADGQVIGVIFAASTSDPDVGYALTAPAVAPRAQEAQGRRDPVSTGRCAN